MSASDPYLQPNGVLRNKLGIQDGYEFLAYEKDFVVTRYIDLKKQTECPAAKRAVSRRGISLCRKFGAGNREVIAYSALLAKTVPDLKLWQTPSSKST